MDMEIDWREGISPERGNLPKWQGKMVERISEEEDDFAGAH
jgi:hypothetical protein